MADDFVKIKRALISVSDKTALVELAKTLTSYGVEIISTGGTAKTLRNSGFIVTDVCNYTNSPEILDGRVKTLHPKVHGGLLCVRGNESHKKEMRENDIGLIDLVVVNFYPFDSTVASGADFSTCIENIDIGGPSMMRSAAKNHMYVAVLADPSQYGMFLSEFTVNEGAVCFACRKQLAAYAFSVSASYDTSVAAYFAMQTECVTPIATRCYVPQFALKYGCNPHQKPAAIYSINGRTNHQFPFSIINGLPGYINFLDASYAWQLVSELKLSLGGLPAAASFKHCSPAGAAVGAVSLSLEEAEAYEISDAASLTPTALAYVRARNADPMCSFGDFVAISGIVDVCTANVLRTEICDGIVAAGYEPEALDVLKSKKKGGFIIILADENFVPPTMEYREVFGMSFAQKRNDTLFTAASHLQNIAVEITPSSQMLGEETLQLKEEHVQAVTLPPAAQRDLVLASIAVKYTQSNSISYALHGQLIGVGAGQQSRVDCVKLAGRKAAVWYLRQHPKVKALQFKSNVKRQERINARVRYIEGEITEHELPVWAAKFVNGEPSPLNEVEKKQFLSTLDDVCLSSDAFFPFRDSIDQASKVGVRYVAQPGGSIADEEIKDACREYGMAMVFTNLRLFLH